MCLGVCVCVGGVCVCQCIVDQLVSCLVLTISAKIEKKRSTIFSTAIKALCIRISHFVLNCLLLLWLYQSLVDSKENRVCNLVLAVPIKI